MPQRNRHYNLSPGVAPWNGSHPILLKSVYLPINLIPLTLSGADEFLQCPVARVLCVALLKLVYLVLNPVPLSVEVQLVNAVYALVDQVDLLLNLRYV